MNLAEYHPVVVHFAIGFLVAGAVLRWISLTGRAAFTGPAATALLIAGTVFVFLSVKSGDDAHGPVERVPGSYQAVVDHEKWGERTRNVFVVVVLAELAVLALARRGKARPAQLASGVLCLIGVFCLYEAGEHGGELVYSYAGGVGIRSGDPQDVGRLYIAAAYHQAQADRKAGRPADAAAAIAEVARRNPNDAGIQLLVAESALLDDKNPGAALSHLGRISVPPEDMRARIRQGMLTADAHEAAGNREGARAALQQLASAFPDNARVKQRLDALGR